MTHPAQDSGKQRIVFVLPALTAGGAERVMITLMNGLAPEKFERFFITVSESGPLRSLIDPAIPFFALGTGTEVFRSLPKLCARLRVLQPDIVISTMTRMNFGLLLLRPFFPRTRFIVREAITPSYFSGKGPLEKIAVSAGWRILYPLATLVVSPAQAILDEFQKMRIRFRRAVVLPNPVDTDLVRGGGVEQRSPGLRFACAGRLDPQKGFDRLIEVLPNLPPDIQWHLTIIGEGPQRLELERLIAKHGLAERVELAGYVSNPWPKIAAADAFLMPSRHEGLPNAVLEALACGTPVIATAESGGIAEIASNAPSGSVTIVGNMDEFIAAMSKIKLCDDQGARPSLLPREYEKSSVLNRFTELLARTGAG